MKLDAVSFGAGVQSTAIVLMSLAGELDMPDVVIFTDTQSEPVWVYDTMRYVEQQCKAASLPFYRVTAGNLMENTLAALDQNGCGHSEQPPLYTADILGGGREGRLWRKCTTDYKIEPLKRKAREILGISRVTKDVQIVQWLGISLDEIGRAKPTEPPWQRRYPLIEKRMTRHDCILWLESHGHPIPKKSACIMCPFRSAQNWLELQRESPEDWQRAVEWDVALRRDGKLLPGVRNPAYVHRSLVPLGEVNFNTNPGQLDMFMDECEGVCGV